MIKIFCQLIISISICILISCNKKKDIDNSTNNFNYIEFTLDTSSNEYKNSNGKSKTEAIKQILDKARFNGTILVAQEGAILFKGAFGYANIRQKTKLHEASIFQLASVSKQFTAVSILKLKERGLLSYDDKIEKFYPHFPYKNITIRMLLSHRSGLSEYMWFCDHITDRRTPLTNQGLIDLMCVKRPGINFNPNRRHDYSNTGYAILAAIVEKLSKKTFKNFVESEIFKPLGMTNSFVFTYDEINKRKDIVTGHLSNGFPSGYDYQDGIVGDKGVFSCIEDLYKWDQGLYSGKIVKLSTLEDAYTPANTEFKGKRNYGFGWRTHILDDDSKVVFHAGLWHGFSPYFSRRLCDKATIIVLSNRRGWDASIVGKIYKVLDNNKSCDLEVDVE